jgi:FkbM family methyltransferase
MLPNKKSVKLFSKHELYIEKEIFWTGIESEFEPFTLKMWMQLSEKAKLILDIGANTGVFSLLAAKCSKEGRVIAFEPVQYNYSVLLKNISINPDVDVTLEKAAVSNREGFTKMHVQSDTVNYINSLEYNRFSASQSNEIEVALIQIDSYIKEHSIQTVDLIKIDVEGHEESVLQGALQTINKHSPDIILEILNDEMGEKIEGFFAALDGYQYYYLDDEKGILEHRSSVRTKLRTNYLFSTKKL